MPLSNNASHPTNTYLYGGRKAALSLDIIIVGCGIGGLGAAHCLTQAGHRVTIVESALAIGEIGAGIQVSPNSSRLLRRWGIGDQIEEVAVRPESINFRRYNTGEIVGCTPWATMESDFGAPYYQIHRADYHKILYNLVTPNITLRLKSTVVACDTGPDSPSVTLATGEVITADLIVGADGVKSYIQQEIMGRATKADPTGDAAYRATVPASVLLQEPDLKEFIEHPQMTAWMAPRRHAMAYPIRANKEMNIVLLHPDDGSIESWTAPGSVDKMREDFADFEPRIRKMLSFVSSTLRWRLMDRKPLSKWVHDSGPVALLGDACHPMLPYRAQGAAMAIEDGAVLGNLFSRLSHRSQIRPLLLAYQHLRLERTAEAQASSRLNQRILHLPDGPEQIARDEGMRKAMVAALNNESTDDNSGNPNQWADKVKNIRLFGYDADAEVDRWWAETGEKEVGILGPSRL